MNLKCLTFSELSLELLYEILALRQEVFVVEQNCPYLDADGKDQEALHCLGMVNEQIVAYTRLLPQGLQYEQYAAIGRVITTAAVRGQGAGKSIMNYSVKQAKKHYPSQQIKISAQQHLDKFYSDLGFKNTGEKYMEDDIPHQTMIYQGIN